MAASDHPGSHHERNGTVAMILAAVAFMAFLANAVTAKVSLLLGRSTPVHIGDVAEFVLLVFAIACFVVAILAKERVEGAKSIEQSQQEKETL